MPDNNPVDGHRKVAQKSHNARRVDGGCDSGVNALGRLLEWEVNKIWLWIEADFWMRKLRDYPADAEMSRHILSEAGL